MRRYLFTECLCDFSRECLPPTSPSISDIISSMPQYTLANIAFRLPHQMLRIPQHTASQRFSKTITKVPMRWRKILFLPLKWLTSQQISHQKQDNSQWNKHKKWGDKEKNNGMLLKWEQQQWKIMQTKLRMKFLKQKQSEKSWHTSTSDWANNKMISSSLCIHKTLLSLSGLTVIEK